MVQQHDRFSPFMTGCCRLADNDTVLIIALLRQLQSLGKLTKVVGYLFFVVRRTGYLVQFLEYLEHTFCCNHTLIV